MQIPVLVEKVEGNGYRARAGEPFGFTVEGVNRQDALDKLRAMIDNKLKAGGELIEFDVPPEHPFARWAGTLDPNDPDVQEWLRIMEENRRKADEDPDYL